ncbi:hypothetical protein M0Q50_01225 [bacterium]|jgi:hypothetical protein|nr:hypothetical protein [bacterium]
MILTEKISLKIDTLLDRTYYKLGYYDKNISSGIIELFIDIKDLNNSSREYIKVKCDICGEEKLVTYYKYLNNIKKYGIYSCSSKCSSFKNKLTKKNKYGDENYNNREKSKETCLEKYGVENVQQDYNIKEKTNNTNIEKYGDFVLMKNDIIKDKQQKTMFEKYGDIHALNIKNFIEKSSKTKKEKYGDENYNNREKSKETCLEKYGVENVQQSNDVNINKKIKTIKKLNNLDIKNITYNQNNYNDYEICCNKCNNTYIIKRNQMYERLKNNSLICTICNPINSGKSGSEMKLLDFIKHNYFGEILHNSRKILDNKYELDIYLPELKLSFEFNGLYWHNELNKPNDYHKNKSDLCLEKGIQLIHIWSDDFIYKQEIIESMILNKIGKTSNKIFARKCSINVIEDNKLVKEFLYNNHIQGFVGSSVKIGLYYENELVSLMTFGKKRKLMNSKSIDGEYELLRFCNKLNTNVVGGASKLFKYFIRNYNYKEITTYADRSHSNGNLYKELGFNFVHMTQSNYHYIINGIRYHRFGFRKDVLVKEGFDPNKTEHEIMLDRKIYRIYNAGNIKYVFK